VFDLTSCSCIWEAGRSQVQISESLNLDRKTVRKFPATAVAEGLVPVGPPVQNPTNDAAHASYDKLNKNADGSFDMYFGRAHSARRPGKQLDPDGPRQRLLPDVPPLQRHRAAVGRNLGAARRRADLIFCQHQTVSPSPLAPDAALRRLARFGGHDGPVQFTACT